MFEFWSNKIPKHAFLLVALIPSISIAQPAVEVVQQLWSQSWKDSEPSINYPMTESLSSLLNNKDVETFNGDSLFNVIVSTMWKAKRTLSQLNVQQPFNPIQQSDGRVLYEGDRRELDSCMGIFRAIDELISDYVNNTDPYENDKARSIEPFFYLHFTGQNSKGKPEHRLVAVIVSQENVYYFLPGRDIPSQPDFVSGLLDALTQSTVQHTAQTAIFLRDVSVVKTPWVGFEQNYALWFPLIEHQFNPGTMKIKVMLVKHLPEGLQGNSSDKPFHPKDKGQILGATGGKASTAADMIQARLRKFDSGISGAQSKTTDGVQYTGNNLNSGSHGLAKDQTEVAKARLERSGASHEQVSSSPYLEDLPVPEELTPQEGGLKLDTTQRSEVIPAEISLEQNMRFELQAYGIGDEQIDIIMSLPDRDRQFKEITGYLPSK